MFYFLFFNVDPKRLVLIQNVPVKYPHKYLHKLKILYLRL